MEEKEEKEKTNKLSANKLNIININKDFLNGNRFISSKHYT